MHTITSIVISMVVATISVNFTHVAHAAERGAGQASTQLYNPDILGDKFDRDATKIFKDLAKAFEKASDADTRQPLFDQLIAMGPRAAAGILPLIDYQLSSQEAKYIKTLEPKLHDAYIARLNALTAEQILQVQKTRRMWQSYAQEKYPKARADFQKEFLAPLWQMAEVLLIKAHDIQDEDVAAQRKTLVEFANYRNTCYELLKIDADPTKGKTSPTGIAYPHLDQPPTFLDSLNHLERTLVLINTVAPAGARAALMQNDHDVREVDVQEAEFVMFGNEVRMLSGTIAWRVDPLGCAVERDHSTDRKEGRASGHMSTVPGKHGFTDRNNRMGAPYFNSEGAGGGRDGRGYINGLSYSGEGHGGPLYSQKRNCVGVGRRDGVYTSQYRFDKSIVHECQAVNDELFMPPGLTRSDVRNSTLSKMYMAMQADAWGAAASMRDKVKAKGDVDAILLKFFSAAIDVEVEWFFQGLAIIEQVGDLYELKRRVELGRQQFNGIDGFNERIQPLVEKISAEEQTVLLQAGQLFHKIVAAGLEKEQLQSALQQLFDHYPTTVYVEAAKAGLADEKNNMFIHFLKQNAFLCRYEYPPIFKTE